MGYLYNSIKYVSSVSSGIGKGKPQESRVQYKTCTILYLFCLPFELKFTLRVKVVQRKWQTKTCLVGIMCIIDYNALGFLDKPIYMLKLILTRLYNFRGAMYYLGIILA